MKQILVVEDIPDNRQIIRDMLEHAGIGMIEAEDGLKGVELAMSLKPDLILMDIQLPVLDGYEATRRIRANPETSSTPIIALTSYALSGDEQKALVVGCNAYVAKPISPRKLLAEIHRLLDQ